MNFIIVAVIVMIASSTVSAQSMLQRNTDRTVAELKKWAEQNKEYPTWHGWLLYQGSDSTYHHFISRVMDEWVWFAVKRTELKITDERAFNKTSSALLGYYYVDATKDFVKIKDYE